MSMFRLVYDRVDRSSDTGACMGGMCVCVCVGYIGSYGQAFLNYACIAMHCLYFNHLAQTTHSTTIFLVMDGHI